MLEKTFRESLAILFWVYLVVKVFVYDLDIYIVNNLLPNYKWLLNYKFFIIIGLFAVFIVFMDRRKAFIWCFYIIFYPAIILFWKVPYLVYKHISWILVIEVINFAIGFFKSFRFNFATHTIFLIALTAIYIFSDLRIMWIFILTILCLLLIIYIYRFFLVFKTPNIFQVYRKIFYGLTEHGISIYSLGDDIKSLPIENYNEQQLKKWSSNLVGLLLFNRLSLYMSKKLRDYQNSKISYIYSILTTLYLISLTVISFTFINYGLFKISNEYFKITEKPTLFIYLYYSFNNLFFNSIPEIVPINFFSRTALMIEYGFALMLIGIFLSILISVQNQKHSDELEKVIEDIEKQGKLLECFIQDEYHFRNYDDAISGLARFDEGSASIIIKLSKHIE